MLEGFDTDSAQFFGVQQTIPCFSDLTANQHRLHAERGWSIDSIRRLIVNEQDFAGIALKEITRRLGDCHLGFPGASFTTENVGRYLR